MSFLLLKLNKARRSVWWVLVGVMLCAIGVRYAAYGSFAGHIRDVFEGNSSLFGWKSKAIDIESEYLLVKAGFSTLAIDLPRQEESFEEVLESVQTQLDEERVWLNDLLGPELDEKKLEAARSLLEERAGISNLQLIGTCRVEGEARVLGIVFPTYADLWVKVSREPLTVEQEALWTSYDGVQMADSKDVKPWDVQDAVSGIFQVHADNVLGYMLAGLTEDAVKKSSFPSSNDGVTKSWFAELGVFIDLIALYILLTTLFRLVMLPSRVMRRAWGAECVECGIRLSPGELGVCSQCLQGKDDTPQPIGHSHESDGALNSYDP